MLRRKSMRSSLPSSKVGRGLLSFTLTLLLIEFLDEIVCGAIGAAWPLVRNDLELSYIQVGLLLTVPHAIGSIAEIFLGIVADVCGRRVLVLGGGIAFVSALMLTAASHSFLVLLAAFILFNPASGAFVSLSQASLMDSDPARHEHNMARWALAGSLGMVIGPITLSGAVALGASWRSVFFALTLLALLLLRLAWRFSFQTDSAEDRPLSFAESARNALIAFRRRDVLRWLLLLQFSNLMLDVPNGFLALYFVDAVGVSESKAALAVAVWTGVGLTSDFLLIPLLERVRGLSYLRLSAFIVALLFPAFLLAPGFALKLAIVGLLGLMNAGWYSILKAQLYASMPGQSGAVMAVSSLFEFTGGLIPLALGVLAEQYGLGVTMWLLMAGPIALLIGIPRKK
jgi:FSR family fosmidomycin resistance protein-like MFS transporter